MDTKNFHTWLGINEPGVIVFDCPAGEVAVVCRAKPVPDRLNEDALGVFPVGRNLAVLVVADGMGGVAGGDKAAALVVTTIGEHLAELPDEAESAPIRAALLVGIEEANHRILGLGIGAGTTVAAAVVSPRRFGTVHAGDSMVLVVGQRGRLKAQTLAHSPVGFAQEAGLIDADQAMFHHERHLVTNVVGMEGLRLEIGSPRRFSPRDTLILGSDGLFDNLTVPEVLNRIRCGPLAASAAEVADLAIRRMIEPRPEEPSKPDDLGMILFRPAPKK
ncbi:MAG: PP2C family serine/threonine-protein phosphatase [Planctomycetota bacterium]